MSTGLTKILEVCVICLHNENESMNQSLPVSVKIIISLYTLLQICLVYTQCDVSMYVIYIYIYIYIYICVRTCARVRERETELGRMT
jgi:hypothetical protein